jgi:hypothetical protein
MSTGRPARFQYFIFDNVERKFLKIHDGFVCGRTEGDLQFPADDVISRKQCRFIIDANDVYIEDLGSTNHTKVNTVPLLAKKRRRVQLNDVIEFGRRRFILTNQNKFAPANIEDIDAKKSALYRAIRRTDGSLTSQISRLITKQTRILLDRKTYGKLRVREFAQLRGWDLSTALVLLSLLSLWGLAAWFLQTRGAFSPGLVHSARSIGLKLTIAALPCTGILTLWHYLSVRKRYRSVGRRLVFIPLWLVAAISLLPLVEAGTSVVTDAAENLVDLNCVKSFSADSCRTWAGEDALGFKHLPRDVQAAILERLGQKPAAEPQLIQGSSSAAELSVTRSNVPSPLIK